MNIYAVCYYESVYHAASGFEVVPFEQSSSFRRTEEHVRVYPHILCSAFDYYEESQLQLSHFQHSWWIKVMSLLFAESNW